MPFEVLHCALVLFGFSSSIESPEVFSFARLGVFLTRIETVFSRFQFSDHSANPSNAAARRVPTTPLAL
jgi:hypothetical protein